MAITQSGATVNTEERDQLRASNVDTSITSGGAELNTTAMGTIASGVNQVLGTSLDVETSGATLAGVTASFAQNVCSAIDTYKANVMTYLDQLQDANSKVAFQGEGISQALTNFIDSVREVATSYLNKLSEAEQDIVNSVQAAYQTQDTDLSGSMSADAGTLTSTSIQ